MALVMDELPCEQPRRKRRRVGERERYATRCDECERSGNRNVETTAHQPGQELFQLSHRGDLIVGRERDWRPARDASQVIRRQTGTNPSEDQVSARAAANTVK